MARYNATYTSVWDGGIEVNSRCCANRKTKKISKIGKNDICSTLEEQLEELEDEYIKFDDTGEEFKAMSHDTAVQLYGSCYDVDMSEIEKDYGVTYIYNS